MHTDAPPYARRWQALVVLALSLFVVTVDNTILNVALPTIRASSTPARASCSGSSTPTCSSSPACC